MKGHEHVIAMRKAGYVPSVVLVHLHSGMPAPEKDNGVAWVQADVAESFERADLRFLVDLRVLVHGPAAQAEAVKSACAAALKAKAASVLGYATDRPKFDPESLVYAEGDFAWLN